MLSGQSPPDSADLLDCSHLHLHFHHLRPVVQQLPSKIVKLQ